MPSNDKRNLLEQYGAKFFLHLTFSNCDGEERLF